ncbi:MAG: hypothetical protein LBC97_15265 [Bifidobacteriaceae bacterium]|jgi:alpha-tubulin suppressor-like RCC1 family protein|nr:hypothetical protein [Bifidobacteriaceae bacterium]
MANNKVRTGRALRAQRIWTVIATTTAVGALVVTTIGGAETGAQAARAPEALTPVIQPAVLPKTTAVTGESRKDRRTLQAGVTILDGELYLWGWGVCGALGVKGSRDDASCLSTDWGEPDNRAPTTVEGLPSKAIKEVTGGIYNFNAVDTAGYVWGWGSYANRDGTGGSNAVRNSDTGNAKYGKATGASWPPQRLRIGAAWDDSCWGKDAKGKAVIKENCGKPLLGQNDPVELLSSTEMSGAAVTKSGLIYSWGGYNYGGVGTGDLTDLTDGKNRWGAVQVRFPADFDVTVEGNQPDQLEGGYQTYWVMLKNGQVWYFGGNASGTLGSPWERAEGDHPAEYSGRPGVNYNDYPEGEGQIAVKSVALEPWFRENSPSEYIVQVHSGIGFGAALLSTGRMLTWGRNDGKIEDGTVNDWGAVGRRCAETTTAARDHCYRSPGFVQWDGTPPNIVQFSCSFTAVTALADDGTLYGWGAPVRSYEGYPSKIEGSTGRGSEVFEIVSSYKSPDPGAIIVVARNVKDFQTGQGFVIWWDTYGKQWGRGWHEHGSLGHHGGNWGRPGFFNETRTRWVWFSEPQYEDCQYSDQKSPGYTKWTSDDQVMFKDTGTLPKNKYNGVDYYCMDLNQKSASGKWLKRFSLEECLEGLCEGP